MEERLDEILKRLDAIEERLSKRYEYNEESIINYLNDIDRATLIGVNCNMIYEAYKCTTDKPVSIIKLNRYIKEHFGLKVKHTTKNKQNIYYWGE